MKPYKILIISILMCLTNLAVAKNAAKEAAEKSLVAVTVFMDVNKLTRKNLAARKMTKIHNEFAAEGYELVTVNPYIENGDLEGFFLSYKVK